MPRHVIAPDPAPVWAQLAFGWVGLDPAHELSLYTASVDDPLNATDVALLAAQGSGTAAPEGETVLDYVKAIHEGLEAHWSELEAE